MPRRNDIAKILVIGSGPIVIGQSAEFDYSGTQACKALKAEGYEVVLVNSNPASIMTDPEVADRTYIEPLTAAYVEEIIRVEVEMMRGSWWQFSRGSSAAPLRASSVEMTVLWACLRCCRRWVDRRR